MPPTKSGCRSRKISFICHYYDEHILNRTVGASLRLEAGDEFLLLKGFKGLAPAYIEGEKRAENQIICFIHQDIWFPPEWRSQFNEQLREIEKIDKKWSVIGLVGAFVENNELQVVGQFGDFKHYYNYRVNELPMKVQAVDASICFKQKGKPHFDPHIPSFHGSVVEDVCYQARNIGRSVWVAHVYMEHRSPDTLIKKQNIRTPTEYMIKKWGLPVISGSVLWV